MKNKIIRGCSIILVLAIVLASSCAHKTYTVPSDLALLVPSKADLIAKVEIQQIINDVDFAYLYERFAARNVGMPRTVNEALEEVRGNTGINPKDFTEAVVFADTSDLADLATSSGFPGVPYFGALLRGNYTEKDLIRTIESKTGTKFRTYTYKGARIYTHSERQIVLFSITFVDNGLIIFGAANAVEDTIDVMLGDRQPVSGSVYNLYQTLGNVLFKLASSVPSSLAGQIPSTLDLDHTNANLQPLKDVSMVGFTFGKAGSSTITEVQLHCVSPSSAQGIDDLVRNLIALGKQEAPNASIEHSLDNVQRSIRGSIFSLTITETTAEIEDLMRSLMD